MSASIKTLAADATPRDTAGYAKALQVKASAGKLRTLQIHSKAAGTVYIQFHFSATTPAEGAVPARAPIPLVPGVLDMDTPVDFTPGLYICASSTAATKTLITTDDVWITATIS